MKDLTLKAITDSSEKMSVMQEAVYEVETFLNENYQFRRNVLSGKVENLTQEPGKPTEAAWKPVTTEVFNGIVRHAKMEGIGGNSSPRKNIEEYVYSDALKAFDPIRAYLDSLPQWDGHNHVADMFGRIPGLSSEQLAWCCTWIRSAVAHWLGMDLQHGNETVPVLIGQQGCGKSTFAIRLLPEALRVYFLDHINFGNKFDCEMALTHNLLVNIDEFANMGASQQGKLKQTLSKVKVNGRPIFGRCQEERRRYASFLATTNDERPLCDPTGSRRFLCLHVAKGCLIDNLTPIPYEQFYAQILHELKEGIPYWFSNDEVARIQQANIPYLRTDDMEGMLCQCFRLPKENEDGKWVASNEVYTTLLGKFTALPPASKAKLSIGRVLRYLGCQLKHTNCGQMYKLIPLAC